MMVNIDGLLRLDRLPIFTFAFALDINEKGHTSSYT